MSLLYPVIMLRRVSDLSPEMLSELNISCLILDADNTLTTHNNPVPDKDVLTWIKIMRENGIKLIIASNNSEKRIKPFAKELGLDYASRAMKPLPTGFLKVSRRLGIPARSFGVVGDQIFTDILGGNLFGAKTILVEPMKLEDSVFFKLKRRIEAVVIKKYKNREG